MKMAGHERNSGNISTPLDSSFVERYIDTSNSQRTIDLIVSMLKSSPGKYLLVTGTGKCLKNITKTQ